MIENYWGTIEEILILSVFKSEFLPMFLALSGSINAKNVIIFATLMH